jgi:hypothetical protein
LKVAWADRVSGVGTCEPTGGLTPAFRCKLSEGSQVITRAGLLVEASSERLSVRYIVYRTVFVAGVSPLHERLLRGITRSLCVRWITVVRISSQGAVGTGTGTWHAKNVAAPSMNLDLGNHVPNILINTSSRSSCQTKITICKNSKYRF